MRDKSIEAMRAALTITGLVLLFIFGARAASQARDMSLAGGNVHRFAAGSPFAVADMTRFNPLLSNAAIAVGTLGAIETHKQQTNIRTTYSETVNSSASASVQSTQVTQPSSDKPAKAQSAQPPVQSKTTSDRKDATVNDEKATGATQNTETPATTGSANTSTNVQSSSSTYSKTSRQTYGD